MKQKRIRKITRSFFIKLMSEITAFLIKSFWLGKVEGLSNIPETPCIVISNHESYLDFLLLGYTLKRKSDKSFRFWAKTKVVNHTIWKIYSNIFNSIEVNGNIRKLYELSTQALNIGEYVCIFPEGRRTRDGDIQPFKEGYLRYATSIGIEIVPAYLTNTFRVWPAHNFLPKFRKCGVTFYPSIKIEKNLTEDEIHQVNLMIIENYKELSQHHKTSKSHTHAHLDPKTT